MLGDVLSESMFLPSLDVQTKEAAIDRLLECVCATGKVRDRAQARADILANEGRMSTGMQHGIAIPHAKSDTVDEIVAAVATTQAPVGLPGPDREQARIFILLLSPKAGAGPHVRFLAEIARVLKHRSLRQRLIEAVDAVSMRRVFIPADE